MEYGIALYGFYTKYNGHEHYTYNSIILTGSAFNNVSFAVVAEKLGFSSMENYVESYPGKFNNNSRLTPIEQIGHTNCLWITDDGHDKITNITRSIDGGGNYPDENYPRFLFGMAKREPEIVAAPTIKEFIDNSGFPLANERDLWFCIDWRDT